MAIRWEPTAPGAWTPFRCSSRRTSGAYLEAGLIQRARLLNTILADLYGPQKLLLERRSSAPRWYSPTRLSGAPAMTSRCRGQHYLHLLAVDLARSPDGQWWVISDRTQAPSGAGYALENRIVMAETFPDLFRESQVQRLASFFRDFRETLLRLSPSARTHPRVVLLTPGPLNETYFEHSYLARYLGFTLVQGGDLTVRENRVFLKSLEGLRPVDVILRRMDDGFCDPLELRSDSYLGVPGLVEAVRSGNVAVANALGSGLIETSAFMPFLPGLSRSLLGERLTLPSVATWWCGQPAALRYVRQNLDFLVIKPAFPARGMEPVFGGRLGPAERSRLLAQLEARPNDFVGQELLNLSSVPVWSENGLMPRRVVLRVYIAAAGDSWIVMPGGLTRVSPSAGHPGRFHAARRRQQRYLGSLLRAGRQLHPAPPARFAGRAQSRSQQRPAQPRRRTSLLAGPLCRTLRAPGARAALHSLAHDRRILGRRRPRAGNR